MDFFLEIQVLTPSLRVAQGNNNGCYWLYNVVVSVIFDTLKMKEK